MIYGTVTTPKKKQRDYWQAEIRTAKRAMKLYPVGSDEREIYRGKLNAAIERYNDLFEEVYRK